MASAISRRPWPTLTTARPAKPSISFLPSSVAHPHALGPIDDELLVGEPRVVLRLVGPQMADRFGSRRHRASSPGDMISGHAAPEAPIVLGELRARGAHVGPPARRHVGVAPGPVLEGHAALHAAHERARGGHLGEPTRLAQL